MVSTTLIKSLTIGLVIILVSSESYSQSNSKKTTVPAGKLSKLDSVLNLERTIKRLEEKYPTSVITYLGKKTFKKTDAGRIALIDENGLLKTKTTYDHIGRLSMGNAIPAMKAQKWGYLNLQGEETLPLIFDYAAELTNNPYGENSPVCFGKVTKDNKSGLVNSNGKIVIPAEYDKVYFFHTLKWKPKDKNAIGNIILESKGKFGLATPEGKIIVEPQFDEIQPLVEGLARVKLDKKVGFIDNVGNIAIPITYQSSSYFFEDGIVAVYINSKWGYIDRKGTYVTPPIFDEVKGVFKEGLTGVKIDGKYGFIDKTGKQIIPPVYDYADNFVDGFARVQLNNKFGLINRAGKSIVPCMYKDVSNFTNGYALVKLDRGSEDISKVYDNYGAVNKLGKLVVPINYSQLLITKKGFDVTKANTPNKGWNWLYTKKKLGFDGMEIKSTYDNTIFNEESAINFVFKDKKFGAMTSAGKWLFPIQYDESYYQMTFENGLMFVTKNAKSGYIDRTGKEAVPCIYDVLGPFTRNIAVSKVNGTFLLIDKNGKMASQNIYQQAHYQIKDGLILVKKENKWGVIDVFGNIQIPFDFDDIDDDGFCEGLMAVKREDKWGYIDKSGITMLPFIYDHAREFSNGYASVVVNGREIRTTAKLNYISD